MKRVVALVYLVCVANPAAGKTFRDWKPGDKVEYARSNAPAFHMEQITGEHYGLLVPDTLDLCYRALLALNVLTETFEPGLDYEQHFWVYFNSQPPVMTRDFSSICDLKFLESLPLMRIITGSDWNRDIEEQRLAFRLRMVGDDGFLWDPLMGRPWMEPYANDLYLPKGTDVAKLGERMFVTHLAGRWLGVLALQYQLTGDELWRRIGEKQVDAFNRLVCRRDDYAFTPVWAYFPAMMIDTNMAAPTGVRACKEEWIIQGLTQFYRASGYQPAIELAGKLVRFFRYHAKYYGPKGEYDMSDHNQHHCHDLGLLAMADFAVVTGDQELLEFTREGYEHGRAIGNAEIGFFPETYYHPSTCEGCSVGDMVSLAILLSRAGAADYWDDADRYLRNNFAELQLTDPQWVYRHLETQGPPRIHRNAVTNAVVERNVGGFAGWAGVNDWYPKNERAIMQCCTGNCTRAIYYAWEHILNNSNGNVRVNLLLNRASPAVDVLSYIPYEGRVDFHVKEALPRLEVRIPEWAKPDQVTGTIDGRELRLQFAGRYADFGPVNAGQKVVMKFPISERTEQIVVNNETYHLIIKGSTVVSIDPPGKVGPLYQREYYHENHARWHVAQMFAPYKQLLW
jgi:hypothetical protein